MEYFSHRSDEGSILCNNSYLVKHRKYENKENNQVTHITQFWKLTFHNAHNNGCFNSLMERRISYM